MREISSLSVAVILYYVTCSCYFNATSNIQVATSKKLPDWSFDRVVFPGQRLLFEAPSDAYLEIHTSHVDVDSVKQLLPIKCDRLRVDDGREQ